MSESIHPTAIIDPGAQLGSDVSVGPYAVIEADVVIGNKCVISSHAVIKRYVSMGDNNQIFEHATIGGTPQDFKFKSCESRLLIGSNNIFREGVTAHRSNTQGEATRIGDSNFFMAYSHVAHDCHLGNNIIMANGALLGGHVTIEDSAFISGAVTIHQFCKIGKLAMLGASARVTQDCLPFTITEGSPARSRGLNVIGLKRAGMSAEDIKVLKQAANLLKSGQKLEAILDELKAHESEVVGYLADFIRNSERGFTHYR